MVLFNNNEDSSVMIRNKITGSVRRVDFSHLHHIYKKRRTHFQKTISISYSFPLDNVYHSFPNLYLLISKIDIVWNWLWNPHYTHYRLNIEDKYHSFPNQNACFSKKWQRSSAFITYIYSWDGYTSFPNWAVLISKNDNKFSLPNFEDKYHSFPKIT